jgi:PPP family 3-phenylpropionic acid transporter
MPYLPAWLQARGLDPREIGIVLAAPMLIHIVAVPLATRLVDRRGEVQSALAAAQGDFSAVQGGTFAAAMGVSGVMVAAFAAPPISP